MPAAALSAAASISAAAFGAVASSTAATISTAALSAAFYAAATNYRFGWLTQYSIIVFPFHSNTQCKLRFWGYSIRW